MEDSRKDPRIGQGFATATTETLLTIRENFFRGLDRAVEHMDAGTLHVIAEKRSSTPAEAGRNILGMLTRLDEELAGRENRERDRQTH